MSPSLPPLESRTLSSGFAKRTLKNLDFIKRAYADADVHPVTQVINSLLGLLVFPIEKEDAFFSALPDVTFSGTSNLPSIGRKLIDHLPVPSLKIVKFERCADLGGFFHKVRNAISHKHIEFSGADPDSRLLPEVTVILKDCLPKNKHCGPSDFHWEISMTAEDLEKLSRYVAAIIIDKGL
jgi:hypothetical protein